MEQQWYIIRKRGARRWTAYQRDSAPQLKRGYEWKGPFPSLVAAMMAAQEQDSGRRPPRGHHGHL